MASPIIESAAGNLANAVCDYYRKEAQKLDHVALSGIIDKNGTKVNYMGKVYDAILAIDLAPIDGQMVFFQFNKRHTLAIVIGA